MADGRNSLAALLAGLLLGACAAPPKSGTEPAVELEVEPDVQPQGDVSVPEPAPEEPAPETDDDFRTATSRGGKYTIQWRPVGGEVPKNEHFELEVRLFKNVGDELVPLPDTRLAVSGWMPDHGHGMIRQPQAMDQGDGTYLVRGMLFHMGGHWQLFFDVIEGGLSERTDFELDL